MLFLFAPQVRVPLGEGQMGPFEVRTLTKEGATIDVPRAGRERGRRGSWPNGQGARGRSHSHAPERATPPSRDGCRSLRVACFHADPPST